MFSFPSFCVSFVFRVLRLLHPSFPPSFVCFVFFVPLFLRLLCLLSLIRPLPHSFPPYFSSSSFPSSFVSFVFFVLVFIRFRQLVGPASLSSFASFVSFEYFVVHLRRLLVFRLLCLLPLFRLIRSSSHSSFVSFFLRLLCPSFVWSPLSPSSHSLRLF